MKSSRENLAYSTRKISRENAKEKQKAWPSADPRRPRAKGRKVKKCCRDGGRGNAINHVYLSFGGEKFWGTAQAEVSRQYVRVARNR